MVLVMMKTMVLDGMMPALSLHSQVIGPPMSRPAVPVAGHASVRAHPSDGVEQDPDDEGADAEHSRDWQVLLLADGDDPAADLVDRRVGRFRVFGWRAVGLGCPAVEPAVDDQPVGDVAAGHDGPAGLQGQSPFHAGRVLVDDVGA